MALTQADPGVFLLAGCHSSLNQPALDEFFPCCAERGAHVVVGGPYNSGIVAGGKTYEYQDASPDKIVARDRPAVIADRHDLDLRVAALQFCATHPVVAAVISGTKSPERVRENLGLMQQSIPPAFWQELKREGVLPENVPTPA